MNLSVHELLKLLVGCDPEARVTIDDAVLKELSEAPKQTRTHSAAALNASDELDGMLD